MADNKKISEMWNRKQLPKKEVVTTPVKEQAEAVKQNADAIKQELKDKPEIQEVVASLKEQGYNKEEIEEMINKAGDTFINKLLSAIQGEKAKEENPSIKPEIKPQEEPKRRGLFK